jgi:hypothetical protein
LARVFIESPVEHLFGAGALNISRFNFFLTGILTGIRQGFFDECSLFPIATAPNRCLECTSCLNKAEKRNYCRL